MATVHLCRVPFDNTYDNVIEFSSLSLQSQYFTGCTVATITNSQYVKKNDPYIVVPYSYENANVVNSNYVWVEQNGTNYFFFITDKRYNKSDATYLDLEYDVWQSNMIGIDYSLASNYINRSHVDRWNTDNSPIWWTADEGFDISKNHLVRADTVGASRISFVVITIVSSDELVYMVQAIDEYGLPVYMLSDQEGELDISFKYSQSFDQIEVKSIYMLPYIVNNYSYTVTSERVSLTMSNPTVYATKYGILRENDDKPSFYINGIRIGSDGLWQNTDNVIFGDLSVIRGGALGSQYSISLPVRPNYTQNTTRSIANESKLYTSQFRDYQLSTFTDIAHVQLEEANSASIPVYVAVNCSANRSIVYALGNYGGTGTGANLYTLFNDTRNGDYSLISNTEAQYIQGNYNQNQMAIAAKGITSLYLLAGAFISFPVSAPMSLGLGISALSSAAGTAMEYVEQQSKISDLKSVPENFTVVRSDGKCMENTGFGRLRLFVTTAQPTVLNSIYEFLYHYGYTINTFEIPDVYSRYYFNFISLSSFNINYLTNKRFSTAIKNSLSSIFKKGTRIWHYNSNTSTNFNMLDYTYENCETSLIG